MTGGHILIEDLFRVTDTGQGYCPTGRGLPQDQEPETWGFTIRKPVPRAWSSGRGALDLGHTPDGERCLRGEEAPKRLPGVDLFEKPRDGFVGGIGAGAKPNLGEVRKPQRTRFQDDLDQHGRFPGMVVASENLGHKLLDPLTGSHLSHQPLTSGEFRPMIPLSELFSEGQVYFDLDAPKISGAVIRLRPG